MQTSRSDRTARRGLALVTEAFEGLDFAVREQHESDFGIDVHAELIEAGTPTGRLLAVQVKSGPSYFSERVEDSFVFRADARHTEYWWNHALPVVICLCDVENGGIYWQSVDNETVTSTGKGYKLAVPVAQELSVEARGQLRDLLSPIVPLTRYTIFKTEDMSHAAAKRYSFKVVLNGTCSKREIAAIIREVTAQGSRRRYYRSRLVEKRWGESEAHVVWVFIYPSAEDCARDNYICRSLWISESLDEKWHPRRFDGENIGDGILAEWSSDYNLLAEVALSSAASKEEYLRLVTGSLGRLSGAVDQVRSQFKRLTSGAMPEQEFISKTHDARREIEDPARFLTDMPNAPYECSEIERSVHQVAAAADNVRLTYSEVGLEMWSPTVRLAQARGQLDEVERMLTALDYEMRKVA